MAELQRVSEEELRQLPLRAVVALAARGARRVQSYFNRHSGYPEHEDHKTAVDARIKAAEGFAEGRWDDSAVHRSDPPEGAPGDLSRAVLDRTGDAAAAQAVTAADQARWAALAAVRRQAEDTVAHAAEAIRSALSASGEGSPAAAAAAGDYQKLRGLDLGAFPDFGNPVDLSESGPLGPLWPGGVPEK